MYLHPLSLNPRYAYSALLTPPFLRRSDLFNKLRLSRLCSWNAGKLLTGMPNVKKYYLKLKKVVLEILKVATLTF